MAASGGSVLVLNSGSSSVKFALIAAGTGERVLGGLADEVGTPEAVLRIRRPAGDATEPLPDGSRQAVISRILDRVARPGCHRRRTPRGARGRGLLVPAWCSTTKWSSGSAPAMSWRRCTTRRPGGIEAAAPIFPGAPGRGLRHRLSPDHAAEAPTLCRPVELYERYHMSRYGFHGTSHAYVSGAPPVVLGRPLDELRLVTAHLGNGCSAPPSRRPVSGYLDGVHAAGRVGHGHPQRRHRSRRRCSFCGETGRRRGSDRSVEHPKRAAGAVRQSATICA